MKIRKKSSTKASLTEPSESPSIVPNNTDITTAMSSDGTTHSPIAKKSNNDNDNHTVVTIEHRTTMMNQQQDKSLGEGADVVAAKLCFGMSKPVFMVVFGLILIMMTLAGIGLFFDGSWSRILGLDTQDILKSEITRLENEVATFQTITETLTSEVTRLNTTVSTLSSEINVLNTITSDLNNTSLEIQTLMENNFTSNNVELSTLVQELVQENNALENSVSILQNTTSDFATITSDLSELNMQLENSIDESKEFQESLFETNKQLETQIITLTTNLQQLEEINTQYVASNTLLTTQNDVFQEQNLVLENQITNFETLLMQYFDDVDGNNNNNNVVGNDVVEQLLELTEGNRNLVVKNLELNYEQTRDTWVCDYRSTYDGDNFTTIGKNDPIDDETLWEEIYVDSIQAKILRPLCLYNTTNYENFVRNEILDNDDNDKPLYQLLSSNIIRQSISRYTQQAINYYFTSGFISSSDWADAQYDCNNLPTNLQFMYEKDDISQ